MLIWVGRNSNGVTIKGTHYPKIRNLGSMYYVRSRRCCCVVLSNLHSWVMLMVQFNNADSRVVEILIVLPSTERFVQNYGHFLSIYRSRDSVVSETLHCIGLHVLSSCMYWRVMLWSALIMLYWLGRNSDGVIPKRAFYTKMCEFSIKISFF